MLVWENLQQQQKKLRQFNTICEIKFSNLRPLLPITFLQRCRKSKKIKHWNLESGDQNTFKRSEQMKKIVKKKKKIAAAISHTL